MAELAELAFVKTYLSTISTQPVNYGDDYQQTPQNFLKKIPILPIPVPPPPYRTQEESTPSASISITFKSSKPPQSYTISVQPTDSISDIKTFLSAEPNAPPADAQRLVFKGKALADGKLLKEYNVKEGDIVNLMIKPGFTWDSTKTSSSSLSPANSEPPLLKLTLPSEPITSGSKSTGKHQHIPSVVLSPSPSSVSPSSEKPMDIPLTLDTSENLSTTSAAHSSFHDTVVQPAYWDRLRSFLRSEFADENDSLLAFEDYLCASKGSLSASEIAKIRDEVGVIGMAGT